MANMCATSWLVYGPEQSVNLFYETIERALSGTDGFKEIQNDWGYSWLGNLYLAAGYQEQEVLDGMNIRCKGCITYYKRYTDLINMYGYSDGVLFETETSWEPFAYSIEKLLSDKFPDLDMVYCAEEPGFEIYVNTDKDERFFPDRYLVRFYNVSNNDEWNEYYSEYEYSKMIEHIADFIGKTTNEVNELINNDELHSYTVVRDNEELNVYFIKYAYDLM